MRLPASESVSRESSKGGRFSQSSGLSDRAAVLFVIPPGWPGMAAHHEATAGMGALTPGAKPFLYPPQTVATCAAVTRNAGLPTACLDGSVGWGAGRVALAQPWEDLLRADVLAVLVSQGTALADANFLRLAREARRTSARVGPMRPRVLLFGPSAHFAATPWLEEGLADAVLLGEPEGAIADAVMQLASGEISGALAAAALRPDRYGAAPRPAENALSEDAGRWLSAGRGPDSGNLVADLDALPFPAWDLVPWQPYGAASVLSSRGCPAGCAYCGYVASQGACFRSQTPARTVAELIALAEASHPPRIQVRDPVFAHDRSRAAAICEELLVRRAKLSLACESRPEHFDDELLSLLARAGCTTVKVGLESADPALLLRLGRVADCAAAEPYVAEAGRVARTCARLGIICQLFVMAGLPGQDAASLVRTEAFLRRLPHQTAVRVKRYEHHPGTLLAEPSASVLPETLARLEQVNQRLPGNLGITALLKRLGAHSSSWMQPRQARTALHAALHPEPRGQSQPGGQDASRPSVAAAAHRMERVFLTGGSGFVGGRLAQALVAAGVHVVALVRPGSPLAGLTGLPVELSVGDLAQPAAWMHDLKECDTCFHVAALFAGADRAAAMYEVNAAGTSVLLTACAAAGVRRVICTGTIGTVGRPESGALPDETTPFNLWDQGSHYVRSKYLAELAALSWASAGLEVVIVKPTAPVGAGDARPSATGRRILAALRGEVTPYPAGGVNHVPVTDVVAGHILAAAHGIPGRTYILGHREGNLGHAEFLARVAEAAGVRPLHPPRTTGGGLGPASLTADPRRAVEELGLPQSDLRKAFAESVAWYREHLLADAPDHSNRADSPGRG